MSSRPERVVLVTGTGTEVGKTWVACRLAVALRDRDLVVAARKPVMSYDPDDDPTTSDAVLLARATDETPEAVCAPHRWYPVAMAPPMAAEALGRPRFTVADLVGETVWPSDAAVGLVEAAGGVLSPLADDGDAVTLADHLEPDLVVLVADAGLGTISAVRLAAGVLDGWPVTVVLNRYDPLDDVHRRNRAWLVDRDQFDVVISAEQILPTLLGWG
ncbi:MAG TPA: AAA family ATPase [Acidimicrobiales bacterium]|nr:AAA family ATPase [Acidimicrobiales bacterium]